MGRTSLMGLKENIEQNATIWLLGVSVAAFGAGFGAHKAIQETGDLQPISRWELEKLRDDRDRATEQAKQAKDEAIKVHNALDSITKERDQLRAELVGASKSVGKQPAASFPQESGRPSPAALNGAVMDLSYTDKHAKQAAEIKRRLEHAGVRIHSFSRYEPSPNPWSKPNTVYYEHPSNLDAALAILDLLKGSGVDEVKETPWGHPNSPYTLWLP
jgi:hypothetical protein